MFIYILNGYKLYNQYDQVKKKPTTFNMTGPAAFGSRSCGQTLCLFTLVGYFWCKNKVSRGRVNRAD